MKEYKTLISKGDEENKLKNYSSARFYYHSSLEILPWESYPQNKLKEIDQIFVEKLSQADQLLFKENVQKADEAFLKKEYSSARFYYSRANEINPQENVSAKLKQIEETVSGAAAKRIDAEYEDCIKKADEGIRQKNPSIARFYYQKAIVLKPNETYSVEQLKKLQVEN
jgi:tetratricopeptide (TPR) repeat protein